MKKRNVDPELLSKWWSKAPAKLAGLEKQKGAIAEDLDADLVVRSSSLCTAGKVLGLVSPDQFLGVVAVYR